MVIITSRASFFIGLIVLFTCLLMYQCIPMWLIFIGYVVKQPVLTQKSLLLFKILAFLIGLTGFERNSKHSKFLLLFPHNLSLSISHSKPYLQHLHRKDKSK